MKKAKTDNALAVYAERIEPEKRLVKQRHITDAQHHAENCRDKFLEGGKCWIDGVEELRQCGLSWLAASDKNQYDLYFYNYAETLVKPEQRTVLTREVVKAAIHFATVIKEPIKDLQIAMPFVQKAVNAFAMSKANRRGVENAHIPPSLFAEFESGMKTACAKLRKLMDDCPIDGMDENALDVIIKEGEPIHDAVEKAKLLRKRTVTV